MAIASPQSHISLNAVMNHTLAIVRTLAVVCTLAASTFVHAQFSPGDTVYITDELRLGLFRGEDTQGRATRTLLSGAELTVLERSLMTVRVRTEAGDEGWVKSAYLVSQPPARRRVAELERSAAEQSAELAANGTELAATQAELTALAEQLTSTRKQITDLPQLQAELTQLRTELDNIGSTVSVRWLVIAVVAAAIGGWLFGYWWLDRRVRRQFGGVRVY